MAKNNSQVFAANLVAALAHSGVRYFFLSPGSRSQALAIAAWQLAQAGQIELTVRLDERGLGFTALGAALRSQQPVAVITTSGTAVANLHPAVLEAHHSGVPLILLTADRPHELRGVGANQTTQQVGIFADAVRACFDVDAPESTESETELVERALSVAAAAVTRATSENSGPVQIDIAFREPLSANEPNCAEVHQTLAGETLSARGNSWLELDGDNSEPKISYRFTSSESGVVIAGAGAGRAAVKFAEDVGWPLIAEPSSGARFGRTAVTNYRKVLAGNPDLLSEIRAAVVFGKPTLARAVIAILRDPAVEVSVVKNPRMGFFDVTKRAKRQIDIAESDSVAGDVENLKHGWLARWKEAAKEAATGSAEASSAANLSRATLIREVWLATATEDNLLLGASRLIREAEDYAPAQDLRIFSNRGLAGIDGSIATATGIAIASEPSVTTRALIGDLTFFHDAGSLALWQGTESEATEPNIQIIVGNDNGGAIFRGLEVRDQVDQAAFELLFETPQQISIPDLAAAYGWKHILISNIQTLGSALSTPGRVVIEVLLNRD